MRIGNRIEDIDLMNRGDVSALQNMAAEKAREVENPYWVAVFDDLACAFDHLDAMLVRSEDVPDQPKAEPEPLKMEEG